MVSQNVLAGSFIKSCSFSVQYLANELGVDAHQPVIFFFQIKHIAKAHHFIGYEGTGLHPVIMEFGKQIIILKLYEKK